VPVKVISGRLGRASWLLTVERITSYPTATSACLTDRRALQVDVAPTFIDLDAETVTQLRAHRASIEGSNPSLSAES
jgi:hypothetical protein